MSPPMLLNLKEFVFSLFPSCLKCCRLSRKERAFELARRLLEKEANINSIIKKHRYFQLALKRVGRKLPN